MNAKKLLKIILFPHIALRLVLLPVSVVMLVYVLGVLEEENALSYIAYTVSAYTLVIWCVQVPKFIDKLKAVRNGNKYISRWFDDTHLRFHTTLFGTFLWNTAYAVMQLGLGIIHSSSWYYALALYYIFLVAMRFSLVTHTHRHQPGEQLKAEYERYRICGWIFLAMNLALSVMVVMLVYQNKVFEHHKITTIALAAYTFTTFTMAVINVIKYRKYKSPVLSAGKAINLAAACVSMLTLERAMFNAFQDEGGTPLETRRMMLGATGAAICVFVIAMAVYMIVQSTKQIRNMLK